MARKPIAPGHDPRRKQRAPSEVEMLQARLRQAEQRYAASLTADDDDMPAAGSGYGRDGSRGKVIALSDVNAGPYGSNSAAMQMQTLAQLGGVNPLWGSNEASQIPNMAKVSDTNAPKGMMASTGTANYAGIVQMDSQGEYNTDFYWRHGIRIYDEMARSDPQVRLMLQMVTQPIRSAQPTVVPGSDDPMDIEIASFVETCLLEGMRYEMPGGAGETYTSWDDILRHALSMFQYGFALFELCYTVDDEGFVKWSRWLPMLARTVWRWWINQENDLVGVQQYAFKDYKFQFVNVPIQKLLRFTHMQEGSNYDGIPMLRSAYPAWYYKQQFQRIEAVGIERNSIVPVVVKLPPGATISEYGKATTIVQNMRVNEKMGVVVPANWELAGLEGITNHGRGGIQIQETIQYYDIQIARAFAAQFVNLGSTETGARSLDMSQKRTFLQMLQAECQYLEDVINTVAIKRLVDYNYTNVSLYPKVKFPSLMAGEVSDIAQTIFQLAQVQFLHPSPETEDMLRKALYLPDIPHSLIESTNPAGPDEGSDGGEDQQDSQGNTSGGSGSDAGDDEATGGGDDAGGGDGAGMREQLVRESMLLREALDAAYSRDAVTAGEEHYGRTRAATAARAGSDDHDGAARAYAGLRQDSAQSSRQMGRLHSAEVAGGDAELLRETDRERSAAVTLGYPDQPRDGHGRYGATGNTGHSGSGQGREKGEGGAEEPHASGHGGGGGGGGGNGAQRRAPKANAQEAKAARTRATAEAKGKAEAGSGGASKGESSEARLTRLQGEHDAAKAAHAAAVDKVAGAQAKVDDAARQLQFDQNLARRSGGANMRRVVADSEAKHQAALDEHTQAMRELSDATARVKAAAQAAGIREVDQHGQAMPFSHEDFRTALASGRGIGSEPGEASGVNSTKIVKLNGREYIAKEVTMAGTHVGANGHIEDNTPAQEVAREVAARAISNIVGMGDHVPSESYHLVENGQHYSVQSREVGKPLSMANGAEERQFADAMHADPRHALLEYTIGGSDRHGGNVLFDPASGKATMIDFGRDFSSSPRLNMRSDVLSHTALTRQGGELSDVKLSPEMLHAFTDHAGEIEAAAAKYNLTDQERAGLHSRLDVLSRLTRQSNPTMENLNQESAAADERSYRQRIGRPADTRQIAWGNAGQRQALTPNALQHAGRRQGFLARLFGRGRR